MDIDKKEEEQLEQLMNMEKPESFGPSFVQRNLRIGYNNACYVLERGFQQGKLIRTNDKICYQVAP